MKKIIAIMVAAAATLSLQAQNAKTNTTKTQEKKSSVTHTKDQTSNASLDGKSFKISFTEKKNDMSSSSEMSKQKTTDVSTSDIQVNQADKSDYSGFDANSKVILTFSNGYLHASMFEGTGCPYRLNTSGNDMYAFSARCKLNTGNKNESSSTKPDVSRDTKLAMDEQNKAVTDPDHTAVTPMPDKNAQPNAGQMNNDAGISPPSSVQTPAPPAPASSTTNPQDLKTQSAPATQAGYYATVSGVVSGNSIEGTLSWTDSSGKLIRYSFTGNAATKKEVDENRAVGMK